MYILVVAVALIAGASAKNLTVGVGGGHLVYEQNKTASPAIWKQQEQVNVNVTDLDVISQVVVIDCREDQNGEASILEGGVGSKNVTILLKSPTILRGYCFEVFVYASPDEGQVHVVDNNQQSVDGQQTVQHRIPEVSTTKLPSDGQQVQHPVQVIHGQDQVRQSRHTDVQKPLTPVVVGKEETDNVHKVFNGIHKDLITDIFEEQEPTELEPQGAKTEATVAPVDAEKTTVVDGQQTKLPNVTEKPVETQKPELQEVQKVKTL